MSNDNKPTTNHIFYLSNKSKAKVKKQKYLFKIYFSKIIIRNNINKS